MMKRHSQAFAVLHVAAALLLLPAACGGPEGRLGDPRPLGSIEDLETLAERDDVNVLFILIDTLRADRMSSYGYERETTPALDYLASTGIRFAGHHAQSSWTKSSMASLWTGLYPSRTGVLRFSHKLPDEAVLPAEIFRDAGFRTSGLWRNGWVAPNFGFGQGFELYQRPRATTPSAALRRESPNLSVEGTDADAIESAIEFLRVHGRERWFLYMHLMDVHQFLYDEESALFGTTSSDMYDNSILHVDGILDRFLWYLVEHGYLENTIIVMTSDHGEAFGERGFEGHARLVYPETTDVPFLLSLPFQLDPGVVVSNRSRNVDVWPTVLDLLGLDALPGADGRSLVPTIRAAARKEPSPPQETSYSHLDRTWGRPTADPAPMVAVVDGALRFIYAPDPVGAGGAREELFDRSRDPLELQDRLAEDVDNGNRMRELARGYLELDPAPWGVETPSVELDELQLHQLRALGYAVPGP